MKTLIIVPSLAFMASSLFGSVSFEKEILPMFQDKCMKCHSPKAKRGKPKAGLRMDIKAGIIKGSKENKVLIPGNADESSLYTLTILAPDHDDVMPPESKKTTPLTKEEQEALKNWINEGADFGNWKQHHFKD